MLPEWWHLFRRYRQCHAFKCLPRAGGLNEQDSIEMRLMYEIDSVLESAESGARANLVRNAGPMGALLSLGLMGGRR